MDIYYSDMKGITNMINKQNLWFLTLFSLIMVLSIYYLTMGEASLSTLNVSEPSDENAEVVISENETLVALKVASEEELVNKMTELETIILSKEASLEEKNQAYEELQNINKNEASKEQITKIIKEKFKLDSFTEINGNNIKITVSSKEHNTALANNIIRAVQELYDENKYITIKFDN